MNLRGFFKFLIFPNFRKSYWKSWFFFKKLPSHWEDGHLNYRKSLSPKRNRKPYRNPYEPELVGTGTGMNWNRSGSIRNITAHLINDKNTSIAETCIVFNGKSAGNNPRWIYWSYEFSFFRPLGLRTRRPAGEDLDVKIWRSKGLTPWFYVVFYGEFDGQD